MPSDTGPIDSQCHCPACENFSRAYVRHLLAAKEMLGMRLAVMHNLWFYNNLFEEIRLALDEGRFAKYKEECFPSFRAEFNFVNLKNSS